MNRFESGNKQEFKSKNALQIENYCPQSRGYRKISMEQFFVFHPCHKTLIQVFLPIFWNLFKRPGSFAASPASSKIKQPLIDVESSNLHFKSCVFWPSFRGKTP